jgi:hypothetical protein
MTPALAKALVVVPVATGRVATRAVMVQSPLTVWKAP